jgi:hypothetical protein
MVRSRILPLALLAAAVSACGAQPGQQQQRPAEQQGGETDPTRRAEGGTIAAGWEVRIDDKDAARYTTNDVKFVPMGDGFHITSGPAAIYPGADLPNEFVLEATFNQTQAPQHPEAYGLFFSGKDLADSDRQEYVYFLVRGTGQFLVNHRAGRDVHKVIDWRDHAAVRKQDASGQATNRLTVRAGTDSVRFLTNGQQVAAISRQVIASPGGKAGLRVNHNLDVHVTGFRAAPGAR